MEDPLVQLSAVIILGIGAQWLASAIRLPSILLLLVAGFIAGPATGLLDPKGLFGDVFAPFISLAVGIILFEGGLSLRFSELPDIRRVLLQLLTVGVLVTWVTSALAAYFILDFDPTVAALMGAILVVTGPTVLGPMLRYIRPSGPVSPILKWEGILIDPIGAILAVIVYEVVSSGALEEATLVVVMNVFYLIIGDVVIGVIGALIMVWVLKHELIPEELHNPVSLMLVVAVLNVADLFQDEGGLMAVTVMGVILANQKWITVHHIIEFKENLRTLLISTLFILLSAGLTRQHIASMHWGEAFGFVAVLIFAIRPLSVVLSTIRTTLSWRERLFLAWMAPRGIVAASVSSIFAIRLIFKGIEGADEMIPVTFLVIVVTVALYGLTAPILARVLKIAETSAQGVLFVGAQHFSRDLGKALVRQNIPVMFIDRNSDYVNGARLDGLRCYLGEVTEEGVADKLELTGIGRLLALTPSDDVNSLASLRFEEVFGRSEIYQLPTASEGEESEGPSRDTRFRGRSAFDVSLSNRGLAQRLSQGFVVKTTKLSNRYDYAMFQQTHGQKAIPLFIFSPTGQMTIVVADQPPAPKPGDTIISLAPTM
ncbi:cation:proton antiporter [Kolteria novifilia]|uniref:cation:proton antiporter n=1 Tax=Kolteria novifilia TaxID=2527975 RepID=UPI003AF3935F